VREVDDISLSARERRALQELEKVLRRQDRLLGLRMRSGGRRRQARRALGRGARTLTALSASLMVLTLGASGRWTRRATALAFGAVWLLTRVSVQRSARP